MSIPFIDLQTQYQNNKQAIDQAIANVLQHGRYIMGPEVFELETQLANYVGVKHCVSCSSGTDALLMPLMANGVGAGDAVFTTPFTFVATAEVIALLGATPVFVDVDPLTFNMDPGHLERQIQRIAAEGKLTPRAIMPVDLFGLPADYTAINRIAADHGLWVLQDAAQGFGAEYEGRKTCSLTEVGATSFFPAKPLGCYGDGGAVFTDDDELHEKLVSIRVHGQATSGDKYDNVRLGLTARMDSIQAAVLLEKLKHYEDELAARNRVADAYQQALQSVLITPTVPAGRTSVWAQYSVLAEDDQQRTQMRDKLSEAGVPTAVYYPIPLHLATAYQDLGYKTGDFPVSEGLSQRIFSLPMHPFLPDETVEQIAGILTAG